MLKGFKNIKLWLEGAEPTSSNMLRRVDFCWTSLNEEIMPLYEELMEQDGDNVTLDEERGGYITETRAKLNELRVQIADKETRLQRREPPDTNEVAGANGGRNS